MDEEYVRLQDLEKHRPKVYEPMDPGDRAHPPSVDMTLPQQHAAHGPTPTRSMPERRPREEASDASPGTRTMTSVQSLGDLTHHYTNMGSLGCVIIKGVQGYCSFLNGIYRRVQDLVYEDRPVYRLDTMVPHGNSIAAGKFLYLYYKAGQRAWAVGLRLGSSGVLAYRKSTGLDPVTGTGAWMVSDPQGQFFEDPLLRARMAGGYTVPHTEDPRLLERSSYPGTLPYGFTRPKAESLLLQHYAQHRQGGVCVLRRSTSVADACILSVLDAQGRCHHLQIDASKEGFQVCGTSIRRCTIAEVLETLRSRQLTLVNGATLPPLRESLLDDPKFQELVKHTSSSSASRTTTMSRSSTLSSRGSRGDSLRRGHLHQQQQQQQQQPPGLVRDEVRGARTILVQSASSEQIPTLSPHNPPTAGRSSSRSAQRE